MKPRIVVELEVQPVKHQATVEQRVRVFLKVALRTFGFRCVSVRESESNNTVAGEQKTGSKAQP